MTEYLVSNKHSALCDQKQSTVYKVSCYRNPVIKYTWRNPHPASALADGH